MALPRASGSKVQTFGCSLSEQPPLLLQLGSGSDHSRPVKKRPAALKVTVSCLAALPGVCPVLVSHPHTLHLPFLSLQLGVLDGLQAVWRAGGWSLNVVRGSSVYVLLNAAILLWLGTQVASIISIVLNT